MWKAFLQVVRTRCSNSVHVLDRFHVMQLMSNAIDQTRRDEFRQLRAKGKEPVLTMTRWTLLKNPVKFTRQQRLHLRELLKCNLRSVRAYILK
jgi:transposase